MIAANDKDLPSNDLVYRLASPSRVNDVSWIHPGKCTDEWIIGINLFNVPFKTGVNTASYKYYIDFAKRIWLRSHHDGCRMEQSIPTCSI
jgi:alpha-glucosidase